MRISDWSSDVCSSDLRMPGGYCRAWLLRYTRSVDLEAGLFDHVGPAFLFRDQQFAQVFPRRSDNNEAIAFQQLAHAVRFKCSYRPLIQDVQGFAGRSLGCKKRKPGAEVHIGPRSEERRLGKECVSPFRSRVS